MAAGTFEWAQDGPQAYRIRKNEAGQWGKTSKRAGPGRRLEAVRMRKAK